MPRRLLFILLALLATVRPAAPQAGPQLILQVGHGARVNAVAFSRDGRVLASVSDDGTLKVWDAHVHVLLHDVRAEQGTLQSVAISPDAQRVATGGSDGTVKLWDATTLTLLRTDAVTGGGAIASVAFSPDGALLAAAGWEPGEYVVKLLAIRSGATEHTLRDRGDTPRSLAFSPDGRFIAVGVRGQSDGQNEVDLWEVEFGMLARAFKSVRRSVEALAFTPDGRFVAAATLDGTIELWDSQTTVWLGSMTAGAPLHSLSFAPDGGALVAGGDAGATVWSTASRALQTVLQRGPAPVHAVGWSADGVIAGGMADGSIQLWNPQGSARSAFPARDPWVWVPQFSSDGTLLVQGRRVGSEAPSAAWWDSASRGLRVLDPEAASTLFAGRQSRPSAVTAGAIRGRVVATGSGNGAVGLWNGADGTLLQAIPVLRPQIAITALAFDASCTRLAGGSADALVSLWDLQSGRLLRQIAGHTGSIDCLTFASDGHTLASGAQDRTVRLWDARTGALLLQLSTPFSVHGVAVSPDISQVSAAVGEPGQEGQAIVWDLRGGGSPRVLTGFDGEAVSIAFSSNGMVVAVGSDDRRVRLFDARAGILLATFEGHNGAVEGVALSPDGSLLASGSRDGSVRLWDAREGRLLLTWTTGTVLSTAARQWIAFDPQGYFVGSENAAALVRWRVGQEAEPPSHHARLYFRPDLIDRIVRRGP